VPDSAVLRASRVFPPDKPTRIRRRHPRKKGPAAAVGLQQPLGHARARVADLQLSLHLQRAPRAPRAEDQNGAPVRAERDRTVIGIQEIMAKLREAEVALCPRPDGGYVECWAQAVDAVPSTASAPVA